MTNEDIIRMAREAGAATGAVMPLGPEIIFPRCMDVERFAALVAEAAVASEREACAKVCEDIDAEYEGEDVLATWCAAAIRARGEATLREQA